MLLYHADRRTILFVSIYFALAIVPWFYQVSAWSLVAALVVMTSLFSFMGAVITHNCVHTRMFKWRPLNKVWQVILTLTYGHPVSTYVPGHNMSHHKHSQTARDVMRTFKARHSWHLLNLFLFMPAVSGSIMRNDLAFAKAMHRQRPRWFRQLILEGVVLVGVSVFLIIVDWKKWLIYWQIPHMFAGWGIITMNLLQHDGCDESSPFNHSRNFMSRWLNFWTLNNGFHTIHHITPGLHWSLLPEAHTREVAPNIHPALEQASMAGYVWRTFVWPGKRLRYDGTAYVLPEAQADQNWIPRIEDTPLDISFGAETL